MIIFTLERFIITSAAASSSSSSSAAAASAAAASANTPPPPSREGVRGCGATTCRPRMRSALHGFICKASRPRDGHRATIFAANSVSVARVWPQPHAVALHASLSAGRGTSGGRAEHGEAAGACVGLRAPCRARALTKACARARAHNPRRCGGRWGTRGTWCAPRTPMFGACACMCTSM